MRPRLSDRYIFGELLLPFIIGTLAVLMMLVGNTLFALLDRAMRERWPVGMITRILVLNIPVVLKLTLPVSTALAVSLATNNMARNNEITVLRSIGVPLIRIFLPMLLFGTIVSGVNVYLYDRVVPWAWREQQSVQGFLDNLPSNPIDVGFTVPVENYDITFSQVQKLSDTKRRLLKVVIVDKAVGNDEFRTITTAETADYENGIWQMKNVVHHRYDKYGFATVDVAAPTGTLSLRIDFSQASMSGVSGQSDNEMTFAELTQRHESAKRQGQTRAALEYDVARWFKLSLPMMGIVFALCGPPLALRFSRAGSFTGVLLSIITVFVAWNTLLFMKAVGLGGYLPPVVAAWSTNVLFTLIGLWLLKTQE
jgi:lipopolysaccharide export system permease protein